MSTYAMVRDLSSVQALYLTFMVLTGERTPVGVRMNNPPANIPEHWLLCQAGRKFSAAVWEVPLHKHAPYSVGSVDIERVVEFRNRNATLGVWFVVVSGIFRI